MRVLFSLVIFIGIISFVTPIPSFTIGRCPSPVPTPDSPAWSNMKSTGDTPFKLASGTGYPLELTVVYACFSEDHIHFKMLTQDEDILSNFTACNEPLYKMDSLEAFLSFISFNSSVDLTKYIELEISPHGVLYAATIYNPYSECQNLSRQMQDCDTSGITYAASIKGQTWWGYLRVPFSLLGAPGGAAQLKSMPHEWKVNFFRIDLAKPSMQREFSCWSPTYSNPACFHRPEFFGKVLFDFTNVQQVLNL